ncbi:hypothetical protein QBC37DRAFT_454752 [Rhypophila decipiens]|uniref:Extracellular membrane protein CFEM domain-containing protein n=1 Tax=Rhypophila decipiens TaxID=261697 RepID=A0AAN7B1R9_9PEZI|nr:hypothetical protein QBC37DRAFT_454752 [Rhypophila decipiens]
MLSLGTSARELFTVFLMMIMIVLVQGQAVDPDAIDLSIMPGFKDVDNCLRCWLHSCYYGLAGLAGCPTNACLCRPGKMGGVIPVLSSKVLNSCQDLDDASMTVSFYTAYCSTKGYTSIVSPTVLEPTGAFTETTTQTATITVAVTTVTVYVQTSAAQLLQPWPKRLPNVAAAALVMVAGAMAKWA